MQFTKISLLALLSLTLIYGCSSAPAPTTSTGPEKSFREIVREKNDTLFTENFSDTRSVDVYYVTNREANPAPNYGVTIGKEAVYGLTKVNVPKRHKVGTIESTDNPREDTHRFFRVMQNKALTPADFQNAFKNETKWGVLVFIHGFNVKYEEAVLRAAQLAYDLKFQGKVILWSWPAGSGEGFLDGKLLNRTYEANRKNAEDSINQVADFAKMLASLNIPVHVLVHSMGHQVVVPALAKVAADIKRPFIDELVLNAPDIDSKQFEDAAPYLKQLSHRITLYCSYNDNAMLASHAINGGLRMGACAHVDGVDVINVSEIDDPGYTGLGHGYYASRPILTDVFQVLLGIRAEQRLFIRKSEPNATEDFIMRP